MSETWDAPASSMNFTASETRFSSLSMPQKIPPTVVGVFPVNREQQWLTLKSGQRVSVSSVSGETVPETTGYVSIGIGDAVTLHAHRRLLDDTKLNLSVPSQKTGDSGSVVGPVGLVLTGNTGNQRFVQARTSQKVRESRISLVAVADDETPRQLTHSVVDDEFRVRYFPWVCGFGKDPSAVVAKDAAATILTASHNPVHLYQIFAALVPPEDEPTAGIGVRFQRVKVSVCDNVRSISRSIHIVDSFKASMPLAILPLSPLAVNAKAPFGALVVSY